MICRKELQYVCCGCLDIHNSPINEEREKEDNTQCFPVSLIIGMVKVAYIGMDDHLGDGGAGFSLKMAKVHAFSW